MPKSLWCTTQAQRPRLLRLGRYPIPAAAESRVHAPLSTLDYPRPARRCPTVRLCGRSERGCR